MCRNDISSVKAMTDQEYCSCLQGCYRPAPELQTDMRNFLPCCQFQARNRGRIRKCQGGRSFIHGQQTQTGLPTQRGQWSTVGAATLIPSPQKYTLNTASCANANTSRWISNQMIPSPGCSRQSLQHYEADMPRNSQHRHGQHIPATLPEEMGEVRYSDHPRRRRNGRCLESDTSRRNLIFYRVLHKRF